MDFSMPQSRIALLLPWGVHDRNTATKFAKLHTDGWCYNRKSQMQGSHYDARANSLVDI